jgi:hypothetical protein
VDVNEELIFFYISPCIYLYVEKSLDPAMVEKSKGGDKEGKWTRK